MHLTRIVEFAARKLGLVTIPKWKLDNFLLAQRLARIFLEYKIDCVFDVGANIGQYRNFLRNEVGYEGLIISFEPDSDCVSALKDAKARRSDAKWVIQGYALGRAASHHQLNIMQSSLFNSFLEPAGNDGLFKLENVVIRKSLVEVKRLDDVMDELKASHGFKRAFLKMDTQGFDLEVFAGATACLAAIHGVQTEAPVIPIYKNMPSLADSLAAFKLSGFEVSGLYSLSEARFPHAIEFDCVYLPTS